MPHARLISPPLRTDRLDDGRRQLVRDLAVVIEEEPGVERYPPKVPAGFITDFASLPWYFAWLVRWSRIDIASVVHDHAYETHCLPRREADRLWRVIAMSGEHRANAIQAWLCYLGLRLFGWYKWNQGGTA